MWWRIWFWGLSSFIYFQNKNWNPILLSGSALDWVTNPIHSWAQLLDGLRFVSLHCEQWWGWCITFGLGFLGYESWKRKNCREEQEIEGVEGSDAIDWMVTWGGENVTVNLEHITAYWNSMELNKIIIKEEE